jgi:hypothetical protein
LYTGISSMSFAASTPQQIHNSPLNTSPSKQQWSFPRSSKFGVEPKPICSKPYYDLPPVRSSRSPGFGYGQKYDFTKASTRSPAPNNYKIPDMFSEKKKKTGYSFGLGREAMAVTGSQFVGEKKSPGPGAYDVRETNKVAISYSFKGRSPAPEAMTTTKIVPGPGAYSNYDTMTPKGSLYLSKYKSSGASTFAPPHSGRFDSTKEIKIPGPGAYNLDAGISPKGSYFISKFHSSMARTFGHSMRASGSQRSLNIAPGPGSYRLPSDFGHYDTGRNDSARNHNSSQELKAQTARAGSELDGGASTTRKH